MSRDVLIPFGELLQKLRTQKKIRQQPLADKLGLHRNTIGAWERGDRLPDTRGIVLELAKHLGLDDNETRLLLEASLTGLSPYWHVPYPRNPFFTGRVAFLEALHKQLSVQQSIALSQSYALSGLGGIGKTQLALEYTYQHAFDYRAVFWVAAETIDTIDSSFTTIAEQLQLPEHEEKDRQKIIKAVLRWFATHKEWLLIFDNVEALSLIKPFLPAARQGAILITTRLHSLDGFAHTLELPPLTREEGIQFLLQRTRRSSTHSPSEQHSIELLSAAKTLVEMMDGLPLALDQVGAYVERTGCSLTDYLSMYQNHHVQLLDERSELAEHPHSVVKTILFSFQKLVQVNETAADMLRLCAFLAPDAIPEDLFTQGAASLGTLLDVVATKPYQFNQVLGEALQYSLLYRQPQQHTLSQHRLVQVVLKATLDEEACRLWASRAATLVAASISLLQEKHTQELDDRYLPHAHAVLQHIQQWSEWEEQTTLPPIWYYIGLVAERYSQLTEAKNAYLRGLDIAHRSHSPLKSAFLVHAGLMISDLGDDQLALQHLEQGAELARQVNDGGTLCYALFSKGQIQDNFGHYQQAETLYQEAASIALHLSDWAIASACLQDLGVQAVRRGHYEQAERLYTEGLAYARQSTQLTRQSALLMNLGMLAVHQHQYNQALTYSLESFHLAQRVHNRFRISSVSQNLGIIYRLLGQLEQAQYYLDESLLLAQEIQNLWLIAETQGEYGWLLLDQKQPSEAKEMFERMLTGAQHIQAPELIARAFFGLAQVAAQQHNWEQARSFAQESLERYTQLGNAQRDHVSQWLETFSSLLEL